MKIWKWFKKWMKVKSNWKWETVEIVKEEWWFISNSWKEFIKQYCKNSKVEIEWLMKRQEAIPCDCGAEECQWWQMTSINNPPY